MSQFWAVTGSAGISAGMLGAKQIGDQKQHRITLDLDSGGVLTSRYYQLFNCSSTTEKHFPTGKDTINSVTNVLAEKSIRSSDYLNPEPRMPILKSHEAISKPWNLRRVENQVTICVVSPEPPGIWPTALSAKCHNGQHVICCVIWLYAQELSDASIMVWERSRVALAVSGNVLFPSV